MSFRWKSNHTFEYAFDNLLEFGIWYHKFCIQNGTDCNDNADGLSMRLDDQILFCTRDNKKAKIHFIHDYSRMIMIKNDLMINDEMISVTMI